MSLGILITYIISSILIISAPGPAVTLLITTGLIKGKNEGYKIVPGIALGSLSAMILSLAGVGAILSTSIVAFNIVKVIGFFYLVYMGIKMWVTSSRISISVERNNISNTTSGLKTGFLISFLNPKIIIFFSSFIPQYINKDSSFFYQVLVLGGIYLLLVIINGYFYSYFSSKLSLFIKDYSLKWVVRIGGLFMIISAISVF